MKHKIAFALIMGMITTGIISFVLIAVNVGFGGRFVVAWLRSWAIAYVLAVPAVLFIGPRVQLLVDAIFMKRVPVGEEAQ